MSVWGLLTDRLCPSWSSHNTVSSTSPNAKVGGASLWGLASTPAHKCEGSTPSRATDFKGTSTSGSVVSGFGLFLSLLTHTGLRTGSSWSSSAVLQNEVSKNPTLQHLSLTLSPLPLTVEAKPLPRFGKRDALQISMTAVLAPSRWWCLCSVSRIVAFLLAFQLQDLLKVTRLCGISPFSVHCHTQQW